MELLFARRIGRRTRRASPHHLTIPSNLAAPRFTTHRTIPSNLAAPRFTTSPSHPTAPRLWLAPTTDRRKKR
jgi:hypothetical protein